MSLKGLSSGAPRVAGGGTPEIFSVKSSASIRLPSLLGMAGERS
jgi:hypothetical protein